jgi:hypothetical protein
LSNMLLGMPRYGRKLSSVLASAVSSPRAGEFVAGDRVLVLVAIEGDKILFTKIEEDNKTWA